MLNNCFNGVLYAVWKQMALGTIFHVWFCFWLIFKSKSQSPNFPCMHTLSRNSAHTNTGKWTNPPLGEGRHTRLPANPSALMPGRRVSSTLRLLPGSSLGMRSQMAQAGAIGLRWVIAGSKSERTGSIFQVGLVAAAAGAAAAARTSQVPGLGGAGDLRFPRGPLWPEARAQGGKEEGREGGRQIWQTLEEEGVERTRGKVARANPAGLLLNRGRRGPRRALGSATQSGALPCGPCPPRQGAWDPSAAERRLGQRVVPGCEGHCGLLLASSEGVAGDPAGWAGTLEGEWEEPQGAAGKLEC